MVEAVLGLYCCALLIGSMPYVEEPVGTALAPALANPVGRDPKLFGPISSYTTTSTFGVGQAERKLVDNPQSLDPDILEVYRTVNLFNFASTMMVYR